MRAAELITSSGVKGSGGPIGRYLIEPLLTQTASKSTDSVVTAVSVYPTGAALVPSSNNDSSSSSSGGGSSNSSKTQGSVFSGSGNVLGGGGGGEEKKASSKPKWFKM
jgi:hypothetical protein